MTDPHGKPASSASSPAGIPAPDGTPREIPRTSSLAIGALVLALLPFLPYFACVTNVVDADSDLGFGGWMIASILAVWGAVLGIVSARRMRSLAPHDVRGLRLSRLAIAFGFLSPVVTFILGIFTVSYSWPGGRALMRKGKQVVPPHVERSDWLGPVERLSDGPAVEDLARVAAAWRASGATEAASVAAFSHVACELMAHGAPSELVEGAHQAALDEVRHARACYGFAASLDGARRGPGPLPAAIALEGARDLTALAAATVVESLLLEGAAARVARVLAAREDVARAARDVLTSLMDDEERHAMHGLAIVRWCIARDGEKARNAARSAIGVVDLDRVVPDCPADLERWGVASQATWRACLEEARDAALAELAHA